MGLGFYLDLLVMKGKGIEILLTGMWKLRSVIPEKKRSAAPQTRTMDDGDEMVSSTTCIEQPLLFIQRPLLERAPFPPLSLLSPVSILPSPTPTLDHPLGLRYCVFGSVHSTQPFILAEAPMHMLC